MSPWVIAVVLLLVGENSTHIRHLAFEKNKGQAPADVKYVLRGQEYQLDFKRAELLFHFASTTLRIRFDGPLNKRVPEGHARIDGLVRYVDTEETNGDQDIPKFASMRYDSLYKGIDLVCHVKGTHLECNFVALAGSEPEHIRAFVDAQNGLRIDDSGRLVIQLPDREIRLHKPSAFQLRHGQRTSVDIGYQINEMNEISFLIGEYDHSIPLIINPLQ
jgi:hypothetical protein